MCTSEEAGQLGSLGLMLRRVPVAAEHLSYGKGVEANLSLTGHMIVLSKYIKMRTVYICHEQFVMQFLDVGPGNILPFDFV